MIDPVAQLQMMIDAGIEPDTPYRRLVLQLTGRIADPKKQAQLNQALNSELAELLIDGALGQNSDARARAHHLLDLISPL